jgi:hypothetical protein
VVLPLWRGPASKTTRLRARALLIADSKEFLRTMAQFTMKNGYVEKDFHGNMRAKHRRVITAHQFSEFPNVKFELGWRNMIDIETQQAIISEVYRIAYHVNPKIWIGTKWLATYIGMRPGEMLAIKELHINAQEGFIVIPRPKGKKTENYLLVG